MSKQFRFSLLLLTSFLVLPSVAAAHPLIDKGVAAYEEADFDKSLRFFDQATDGGALTTAELLLLFEWRAIVRYALDNEAGMRADLTRLASMRPTHRLGRVAPPAVKAAFDEVRAGMTDGIDLEVTARTVAGAVRFETTVVHDSTSLARGVRIHYKEPSGEWQSYREAHLRVVLEDGGDVLYYVELLGFGGAVLVTEGTREEPRSIFVPSAGASPIRMRNSSYYLFGGAGAMAAVGIAMSVLANKDFEELQSRCPDSTCTTDQTELADQVDKRSLVADISFAVAGSAAVTGLVLFFVSRKKLKDQESARAGLKASVAPWLSPDTAGATVQLQF